MPLRQEVLDETQKQYNAMQIGAFDLLRAKQEQVDAAVKALTSILEPIMIVIVGGIVGFIVIAMYLPMFKVYDQIK